MTERQAELLPGEGEHPDADRIEHDPPTEGLTPEAARRATVPGRPIKHADSPSARTRSGVFGHRRHPGAVGTGRREDRPSRDEEWDMALEMRDLRALHDGGTAARRPGSHLFLRVQLLRAVHRGHGGRLPELRREPVARPRRTAIA
ncbi:hypothetical protein GCM10010381_54890 [Streptomyces xantholiticus]|nr:hypothetical protein GCM10010381_54890 [Streptomyces xantholiticus]